MDLFSTGELVLELPDHKITVKPYYVKKRQFTELGDKITAARVKHNGYSELPPKPDETREEWLDRYAEFLQEKNKKNKDETAADFIDRVFKPVAFENNHLFLKDVLAACCDLASNQGGRITDEVYEEIPTMQATNFVKAICKVGLFPIPELD